MSFHLFQILFVLVVLGLAAFCFVTALAMKFDLLGFRNGGRSRNGRPTQLFRR